MTLPFDGSMSADLPLRLYRPRSMVVTEQHPVERAAFPAVDAHSHLGRWLSDWVGRPGEWLIDDVEPWLVGMEGFNVHGFINLDGRWGDELEDNLDRFDRAHPGRIATFCQLDWSLLDQPAGGDALVESLTASARAGAAGIKVWKDLGLQVRDHSGRLVLPDDPRLAPVFAAAGELGLPIWWHAADPASFFEPVDERNEYYELLTVRPDWSFHGADFPTFGRLMEAVEAVVSAHPQTTFVGLHGGWYPENLGWVDRMLSTYPNLCIDIAARLAQLGRQPRAARNLFMRHPDRILFGTDEIPATGESYPTHFRFLETADECFPHSTDDPPLMGRWTIAGVHLPDDVLRSIYGGNATRLVPALSEALATGQAMPQKESP